MPRHGGRHEFSATRPTSTHVLPPGPFDPPPTLSGEDYHRAKSHHNRNLSPHTTVKYFDLDMQELGERMSQRRQPKWSTDLEASECAQATLIKCPCIVRDCNQEPILGYFPSALSEYAIAKSEAALREFEKGSTMVATSTPQTLRDVRHRRQEMSSDCESPSDDDGGDQSHSVLHLGTWLPQAHKAPKFHPVLSRELLGNTSTNFSHSVKVVEALGPLTNELAWLFAGLDLDAFSRARRVASLIAQRVPGAKVAQTSHLEAWTDCWCILLHHGKAKDLKGHDILSSTSIMKQWLSGTGSSCVIWECLSTMYSCRIRMQLNSAPT
jgi:hypothetical protein